MKRLDENVTILLRELRIMAAAWEADPEYDGTVTLNAADAHAILAAFDRTSGKTRRDRGGDAGRLQDASKIRAKRVAVLKRELKLTPERPLGREILDQETLATARRLLANHGLKQENDTRLRGEILESTC